MNDIHFDQNHHHPTHPPHLPIQQVDKMDQKTLEATLLTNVDNMSPASLGIGSEGRAFIKALFGDAATSHNKFEISERTFRDLMAFEYRLKENMEKARMQRYRWESILVATVLLFFATGYRLFFQQQAEHMPTFSDSVLRTTHTSPRRIPSDIPTTKSSSSVFSSFFTFVLFSFSAASLLYFFMTGMYTDKLVLSSKYLLQVNRALKPFNMHLNSTGKLCFSRKVPRRFVESFEKYREAEQQAFVEQQRGLKKQFLAQQRLQQQQLYQQQQHHSQHPGFWASWFPSLSSTSASSKRGQRSRSNSTASANYQHTVAPSKLQIRLRKIQILLLRGWWRSVVFVLRSVGVKRRDNVDLAAVYEAVNSGVDGGMLGASGGISSSSSSPVSRSSKGKERERPPKPRTGTRSSARRKASGVLNMSGGSSTSASVGDAAIL